MGEGFLTGNFMIKFENLKIGDRISSDRDECKNRYREVLAIGSGYILYSQYVDDRGEGVDFVHKEVINLTRWSYYTPPKQKKVRVMSPALCCDWKGPYVENRLFMNSEEAKNFYSNFHSWPAKDAQGNPIQIAVEVEG